MTMIFRVGASQEELLRKRLAEAEASRDYWKTKYEALLKQVGQEAK